MLRWALGVALMWGMVALGAAVLLSPGGGPPGGKVSTVRAASSQPAVRNTLVYRARHDGHFVIDAAVNGMPVRFMVDTGATVVALSLADAQRIGIAPRDSQFTLRMQTANGESRAAPVSLREIRLEQLTMQDVSAVVMPLPMEYSLLGMSFLSRLAGYGIRDDALTMEW